jgi:putative ABC transport system permease protein
VRAFLRWALADLRTHRGQAASLVLATAGITASLLISVALLVYAADPWQRLFTATNGAHVWLRTEPGAQTSALSSLPGVTAVSGPFSTVAETVRSGPEQAVLDLRAAGPKRPEVGRPEIESGRWLNGGPADGIVLERSLASALWVSPGDRITLPGDHGRSLRVVGIVRTAEAGYAPGDSPGIAWASPSLVADLLAEGGRHTQTLGLRLSDPGDTGYLVQRAVAAVGSPDVVDVSTWQDARTEAEGDNHLLGLLIGLFALSALAAAAIAVTGGIGARVFAHARDISVLKAVGFTPGQVTAMFLVRHTVLASLGVILGFLATEVFGSLVPGTLGSAMDVWRALPVHAWTSLGVCLATVAVIAFATTLAAWRAGRVPAIPAARVAAPGRRRMSGAARFALRLRLPPALVLGARAVMHRPGSSAATVLRLALPVLIVTITFGTWATVDRLEHDPARVGLAGGLIARPNGVSNAEAERELDRSADVSAIHPGVELAALAPGQSKSVTLRGVGTSARPYPFAVAEGRAPSAPGEAVAGQGLLNALDVSVGQWVRVTVGGTPHILHIVGRCIETEDDGRVISTSYSTLHAQDKNVVPAYFSLELRGGADPSAVRYELTAGSHGTLEVRDAVSSVPDLSPVRGVIVVLVGVLSLIGLVELSTAIFVSVRDHSRDLRAYRAVGMTPQQTVGTMVAQIGLLALGAAALGIGLGIPLAQWLIDQQSADGGIGAGIAGPPSWQLLTVVAVLAVGGAVAASVLPATRATALARHQLTHRDGPG